VRFAPVAAMNYGRPWLNPEPLHDKASRQTLFRAANQPIAG
jgi:hypothetical protein